MLAAALLLGTSVGVWPLQGDVFSPRPYLWGILAALPLSAVMLAVQFAPVSWFDSVHGHAESVVRPTFRELHWLDLALLSALAGVGEEAFFRGFLQQSLVPWTPVWLAIAAPSVLFGLLHWVSPMYALLAFAASLYLGWVQYVCQDLVATITAHALYDFAALLFLVKLEPWLREEGEADDHDE